jgi:hypothetical protein
LPHPALSKGEGSESGEAEVLSFREDYLYYNCFFKAFMRATPFR